MSWDTRCDENGQLEIIVSRWYNGEGNRTVRLVASGFEPFEPVQTEICGYYGEETSKIEERYKR